MKYSILDITGVFIQIFVTFAVKTFRKHHVPVWFSLITARGCKPELAGHVASIAQQASQLHPNASTTPVICIESEGGWVWSTLILIVYVIFLLENSWYVHEL